MITKSNAYLDDNTYVLEFPDLEHINLGDPDIQKEIVKWGFGVINGGGKMTFTKNVRLVALKNNHDDFSFDLFRGIM